MLTTPCSREENMSGENGHGHISENMPGCVSVQELLRPFALPNGAGKSSSEDDAVPQLDRTKLYMLVLLLPIRFNPDQNGNRTPVERRIFEQTFAEIKQLGTGYRIYQGGGWGHSLRFGGDFDEHIRVEFDALFGVNDINFHTEQGVKFDAY